jgi:hypothetical protein
MRSWQTSGEPLSPPNLWACPLPRLPEWFGGRFT